MSQQDDPFLAFAVPDIGEAEIAAVVETLRSGWLTTGPAVAAFEREFAERLGGHVEAVAVNSATAGLHLALEALGVGPGDEVLVPTWTFTATAEVVRYLGAEPVLIDVDADTLNIDLKAAAAAITPRTRVIMPVHFAGLPVDRTLLREFATTHGLAVVEDAAHAFPAHSQGEWVGAGISEATVFSFYATKTMTTGEGGMLVTRDPDLARRARTMRLHGINRDVFDRYRSAKPSWQYEVVAPGFKYNLTDPAAAMGRVQLTRADAMRDRRQAIAQMYSSALQGLQLDLPPNAPTGSQHAWHLYTVRLSPDARLSRDEVIARLAARGVGSSVHFIPLHLHPYWRERCADQLGSLRVASRVYRSIFSLPLSSALKDDEVGRVVAAITDVVG